MPPSPHAKPQHAFGGPWTEEKLTILRKYLTAYRQIFYKNEKARYYTTVYIDAFAGTGYRTLAQPAHAKPLPFAETDEEDRQYRQGSAAIALGIQPPFHKYVFVEQNPEFAQELRRLKAQHPNNRITILTGDANAILPQWLRKQNWRTHRAVLFLDPYGTEVRWSLLEEIAATKAIDLWLLFPLSILRMLPQKHGPIAPLARRLTALFGTDEWQKTFYGQRASLQLPLFASNQPTTPERTVDWQAVGGYFLQRLDTIFHSVAQEAYILTNSKKVPLFMLCFAAGNPRGGPLAVKIASSIIKARKRRPS